MCSLGAAFRLVPSDKRGVWGIWWQGNKLGDTIPYPENPTEQTLWLLASGPSVNELDLSQLSGRTVMAVNGAIKLCQTAEIKPDYFVSTDPDFFEHRMDLVRAAVESGAHCYFSANGISRICHQAPDILTDSRISLIETVNRYFGIPQLDRAELFRQTLADDNIILPDARQHKVGWSHQPTKGVFASNTVTYSACQIASSLGFSRVNILGMDLSADASGAIRAYEQGQNARPSNLDESYESSILPAFQLLASLPLTTTFRNLSPHSRLPHDVMPKTDFRSALAE